mgnify:FL=1
MKKLVLALVAAVFLFPVVAFATSYWSGPKWVANTENWHQLSYFGEAYTVKGYGGAQITYYRNNNYVGGAYAYVDTWQTAKSDYQTVTIWDSLNPVAPKTIYYYGF